MVNENVSQIVSRQLLTDFCKHLPQLNNSMCKEVCHFALERIQPRVISFEEQVSHVWLIAVINDRRKCCRVWDNWWSAVLSVQCWRIRLTYPSTGRSDSTASCWSLWKWRKLEGSCEYSCQYSYRIWAKAVWSWLQSEKIITTVL